MAIVGRQYEQKQLQKLFESNKAEFLAVYGRRRVGKTYLIREFFNKKACVLFRTSGIHKGGLSTQLNLCEIKYSIQPFIIDKKYANHLISREKLYCKVTKTTKQIFHSMIVSSGLKKNLYSEEMVASCATLKDLFK